MSAAPKRPTDESPIIHSGPGEVRVFRTREEAREFARQPLSPEERQQTIEAFEMIRHLHAMILERTGGEGVSEEDFEYILREMREH